MYMIRFMYRCPLNIYPKSIISGVSFLISHCVNTKCKIHNTGLVAPIQFTVYGLKFMLFGFVKYNSGLLCDPMHIHNDAPAI